MNTDLSNLPFDINSLIPYTEFNWDCVDGLDCIHKEINDIYSIMSGRYANELVSIQNVVDSILNNVMTHYSGSIEDINAVRERLESELYPRISVALTNLRIAGGVGATPTKSWIIYRESECGKMYGMVEEWDVPPSETEYYGPFDNYARIALLAPMIALPIGKSEIIVGGDAEKAILIRSKYDTEILDYPDINTHPSQYSKRENFNTLDVTIWENAIRDVCPITSMEMATKQKLPSSTYYPPSPLGSVTFGGSINTIGYRRLYGEPFSGTSDELLDFIGCKTWDNYYIENVGDFGLYLRDRGGDIYDYVIMNELTDYFKLFPQFEARVKSNCQIPQLTTQPTIQVTTQPSSSTLAIPSQSIQQSTQAIAPLPIIDTACCNDIVGAIREIRDSLISSATIDKTPIGTDDDDDINISDINEMKYGISVDYERDQDQYYIRHGITSDLDTPLTATGVAVHTITDLFNLLS